MRVETKEEDRKEKLTFFQDKVPPPQLRHVLLHGAPGRAVVVEPRDCAVDLERRQVEQAALEGVGDGGAERLGGRGAALFRGGAGAAAAAASRGREVGLVGLFLVELEVLEPGDGRVDLVLLFLGKQREEREREKGKRGRRKRKRR